jgi:hypothetical protein
MYLSDAEILMQETPLVHFADAITPITKGRRLSSADGRLVFYLNASLHAVGRHRSTLEERRVARPSMARSVRKPLGDEPLAGVDVHLAQPPNPGVHELVR